MSRNTQNEWLSGNLIPPPVDIYDTGEEYVLKAHMPGVLKSDLDVKFSDGELIIYGRITGELSDQHLYVHREIEPGNYYRAFKITDTVDIEKISAKLENGILTLKLPRYERMKPKEIPIEII
jgi:HSP20 family protein